MDVTSTTQQTGTGQVVHLDPRSLVDNPHNPGLTWAT